METSEQMAKQNSPKKTTEMKKVSRNRNRKSSTVAIITLSILLGLSLILGLTAAFFTANQSATGNITLGNPVNLAITQGGTSVEAFTFSGSAMPGTVYTQAIGVSIPTATSDSVLRCKLTLTNTGSASETITATTDENWQQGEDGYYYYKGVASAGDNINFCSSITVPKTLTNEDANKIYTVTFQVEAIQHANGAASEVWTTAPADWTTTYGSAT